MAINPAYPAKPLTSKKDTHPPGILISDHYIQPYGYNCYRPEGTKDWLIIYTLSGKGLLNNGGKEYLSCTAGTLTILSPGTLQDYFTEEGQTWELLWAHFLPRTTWADWLPAGNTGGPVFYLNIDDEVSSRAIEAAFRRVLSYRLSGDTLLRDELTLNALEEIILLVASCSGQKKTLDPRVKEVLGIISKHYMDSHLIETLADQVCLSPSRLSHLFKEQVGDSIIETLMNHRLKQAEKLIKYTLRPITEIALNVGFSSPDYFTRRFTSYYGVNPSLYRKQHRSIAE
ncbi:AraC family transcriptional regulator [Paenibacillus sp. PK3_47]|nr:AraC family transcriptional regulator [Paenibacillus sp. PK3_47]